MKLTISDNPDDTNNIADVYITPSELHKIIQQLKLFGAVIEYYDEDETMISLQKLQDKHCKKTGRKHVMPLWTGGGFAPLLTSTKRSC